MPLAPCRDLAYSCSAACRAGIHPMQLSLSDSCSADLLADCNHLLGARIHLLGARAHLLGSCRAKVVAPQCSCIHRDVDDVNERCLQCTSLQGL